LLTRDLWELTVPLFLGSQATGWTADDARTRERKRGFHYIKREELECHHSERREKRRSTLRKGRLYRLS